MKKLLLNILKILFGLIIIIFLIYKVGFSNLLNIFKSLNPFYFLIAIIITIFLFIIEVLNIKILSDALNKNITYLKMYRLYMVSWGLSLFTPGNLGQFSLIYLLNREGLGLGEGTAIILLNKFIT